MDNLESFSVFNKVETKPFRKYVMLGLLRDYNTIFPAIIGIFLFYVGIKDFYKIENDVATFGNYSFFIGIVLILNLIVQINATSKKYLKVPSVSDGELLTFDTKGFSSSSEYSKQFYDWKGVGFSETKDYLILYKNLLSGTYLQKKSLHAATIGIHKK